MGVTPQSQARIINSEQLPRPPTPTPVPPTTPPAPPTPTPSGTLSVSASTIKPNGTTTVTASNISPSGQRVEIIYPNILKIGYNCNEVVEESVTATSTTGWFDRTRSFTFIGCTLGSGEFVLKEYGGKDRELAKGSIAVARATPTPPTPPGDTPTPTPSGSLRATTTTITKGGSTSVEVHSVSPSNAALRIQYPSGLANGNVCPSGQAGSSSVTQPADIHFNGPRTFTFAGCETGTSTVKLLPKVGTTALDTISIRVEAQTTPPTPTPLTFGTSTIPDQFYHVDMPVDLKMPTATGGAGKTTYTLEPANGLYLKHTPGLEYNPYPNHRTVHGTPSRATNTVTYTYTARDKSGATDQIRFTITVFDVGLGELELDGIRWGVLGHATTSFASSKSPADGYQFSLVMPASTGFQLNSNACSWPSESPTSSKELQSNWTYPNVPFDIVRCGIGAGGSTKIETWVKLENSGTSTLLFAKEVSIPQSYHQHDHKITFHVRGTYTYIDNAGTKQWAIRGTGANGTGMFPPYPASGPPSTSTRPNPELLVHAAYTDAAEDWNAFIANIEIATTTAADAEMSIVGYWATEVDGTEDKCKDSIACANETGMWLEEPPYWPGQGKKEWTNNFDQVDIEPEKYQYLPAILVHEFGHPLGLANTKSMDSIMTGNALEFPCDADILKCLTINDLIGLNMIYLRHVAHE